MSQEISTLYKLIVLYMLDQAGFALTQTQVSTFILEKGYTNYITLQQAIAELVENELITKKQTANRTLLQITEEGRDTIRYFGNRISDAIKADVKDYFLDNKMELKDEVSIKSDYYKSTSGEYEANLIAKEKGIELINLKLSVPTEDMAENICANWNERNKEVYKKLTELLF